MFRVAIILLLWPMAAHADPVVGKARVIDADTIEISSTVIRLEGIDAPEKKQVCLGGEGNAFDCGDEATNVLANIVNGKNVTCEPTGSDQLGRTLAYCFASDGTEINAMLVATGYAFAFIEYSDRYVPHEKIAKASRLGLWSGTFSYPWCHRDKGKGKPCRSADAFVDAPPLAGPIAVPREPGSPPKVGAAAVGEPIPLMKATSARDCAKRYCKQMRSCSEARYHHEACGDRSLDRDGDGIPCENVCSSR